MPYYRNTQQNVWTYMHHLRYKQGLLCTWWIVMYLIFILIFSFRQYTALDIAVGSQGSIHRIVRSVPWWHRGEASSIGSFYVIIWKIWPWTTLSTRFKDWYDLCTLKTYYSMWIRERVAALNSLQQTIFDQTISDFNPSSISSSSSGIHQNIIYWRLLVLDVAHAWLVKSIYKKYDFLR